MRPRSAHPRRAFTLVELATCLAAIAAGACVFAVSAGLQPEVDKKGDPKVSGDPEVIKAEKERKSKADQIKDSTHIRGLHQSFVVFAQNNGDKFPLPSQLDKADATIKAQGADKDTTANIISILVYNGFFGPELCVSPAESNDKIKVDDDYSYINPVKSAKPEAALWDPAFSADFSDGNTGNFSYAHLMPSKPRLDLWGSKKFDATLPIIGNRAPKITAVTYQGEADKKKAVCEVGGNSKTYAIHGPAESWEGNIAFNDNHVEYVTELGYSRRGFKDEKGTTFPDAMFFNEDSDPTDTNVVLGIFTHAGPSTKNFKSIWD
jgi:hypothetical protein